MFEFTSGSRSIESKCYVTHGTIGHLDPKQPPVKRKPFAAVLNVPFVHKVDLILAREVYDIVQNDLASKIKTPVFSRVILPLLALIEGDFFNEYIKQGNILMLSEGKHGVDNVYSLRDGVLTLTLDKETYERAGLVGKPDGVKGKRNTRPRWTVELNLRLPSMLHGRKAFDRVVYAFKNVLKSPVTWLFIDLGDKGIDPEPMAAHFPDVVSRVAKISPAFRTVMPLLQPPTGSRTKYEDDFSEFTTDLYEWLSLITLESPRIDLHDNIDPYLSRYSPPILTTDAPEAVELIKISWEGFLSSSWAHKVLVQALLTVPPGAWFAMTVLGFNKSVSDNQDCTLLKLSGASREYILWVVDQD